MAKPSSLTDHQRTRLADLEPRLRACVPTADFETAQRLAGKIQRLLRPTGHTARWARNLNWLCEVAMEAGELAFATQRLESVRQLVRPTTRTHLEATALLTVVLIRREEFTVARTLASEVVAGVNNIRSDRRRMQFHKRFLRRIEEEGLLAGMRQHGKRLTIEADEAQARAIELQTLSADELIIHLGSVIPDDARTLMLGFREHVVHALPPSDRKRLPSTTHATAPREIGEKARAALKRVAWGALCDPDDDLHEAWSDNLAVVYDRKWIATAIPSACAKWEIAAGGLAISLIALAFKLGVKVFCRTFAPDSIMIALDDRG